MAAGIEIHRPIVYRRRQRFRWEIALPGALGVYLIAQLVRAAVN